MKNTVEIQFVGYLYVKLTENNHGYRMDFYDVTNIRSIDQTSFDKPFPYMGSVRISNVELGELRHIKIRDINYVLYVGSFEKEDAGWTALPIKLDPVANKYKFSTVNDHMNNIVQRRNGKIEIVNASVKTKV